MSKSDFLFLAVLATIPIQLGKFFWPDFSYVLGIPIDYLAVSLYFTDLVIIAYGIIFLIENFKKLRNFYESRKILILLVFLFNLDLILLAVFINKSILSFYTSLKILEFSAFGIFASFSFAKPNVQKLMPRVITFTLLWQAVIISAQFLLQRSLGLWFLGERTFDAATVGIAHAEIFGRQILRPYGTFPHPNVAASYLVISMLLIFPQQRTSLLGTVLTVLTFSKTAIISLAAIYLIIVSKFIYIIGAFGATLLVLFFLIRSLPQSQIATISERLLLAQAALDLALKNPLFGVGSGNFIGELAKLNLFSITQIRLLQPVHNVFLLILAENGLVGFLLFCSLLLIVLKSAKSKLKIALFVAVLIFASLDHFFWTLQQGRLLFWLAVGFIVSDKLKSDVQKGFL